VFAGSHDAAVTGGDINVKTQSLDIAGQATCGVRLFDIRIGAEVVKSGDAGKVAQLKAYHGQGGTKSKPVIDLRTGTAQTMEVQKLWAGAFGLSLTKILTDAKNFVTVNPTEFLILKFDHCSNWSQIARACQDIVGLPDTAGGRLYALGNLNIKRLRDLQGRVICAFAANGYKTLGATERLGIAPITNLYKPPSGYRKDADGLQYWGKGGTNALNGKGFEGKIKENVEKQSKILAKAATGIKAKRSLLKPWKVTPGCSAADPDALGMMYWTTTGLKKSIEERNDAMWAAKNRVGLSSIWMEGLHSYVDEAVPANVDLGAPSAGATIKHFMPNVVMIDFASEEKCKHIFSLNSLAAVEISKVCRQLGA
jgi:hypothetical protein